MANQSSGKGQAGGRPSKRPSGKGKKVARAASIGATGESRDRRFLGFPSIVALVIVLGIGTVFLARGNRDGVASPSLDDHWHSAYGVYDCVTDSFQAEFLSQDDPDGIHSHQDGVIHIHPFSASVTGEDAQLDVFFDAMGVEVTEEAITAPEFEEPLEAGVECDGEEAIIQVAYWSNAADAQAGGEPDEIITSDFGDVRFQNDGEAYTIARAPLGADIPAPESIESLAELSPLSPISPDLDSELNDELEDLIEAEDGTETDTTEEPTEAPAEDEPTEAPTEEPTEAPTEAPTEEPTE